jgi:hypothetical protein
MADWWANAPPIAPAAQPAGDGGNWWDQAPPTAPSTPWSTVAGNVISNFVPSAGKAVGDAVRIVAHPIDTAKGLYNVGAGALDMANAKTNAAIEPYVPKFMQSGLPEATFDERYKHGLTQQTGHEGAAQAVGQHFGDEFGSVEGFKKSLGSDPIGTLTDVSLPLTLGGGLAARAPGIIGKVGEAAKVAGDVMNPAMVPARGAQAAFDEAVRLRTPIQAPTTQELFDAATAAYKDPVIKDLAVTQKSGKLWKDQTVVGMNSKGFNDKLAPLTFSTLKDLDNAPKGAFFTGQEFNTLRIVLGHIAHDNLGKTEGAAAEHAIRSLDAYMSRIPKVDVLRGDNKAVAAALAEARGNYAAAKRSTKLEQELYGAGINASRANSGMNLDNAIRQRIAPILKNQKLRSGFSKEEITAMEAIVSGSTPENISRRLGNLLGGGGGLGAMLTGALGHEGVAAFSHNPAAAVASFVMLPAAGYALKKLSGAMAKADVHRLEELVRSRSPLGSQMQSSLGKFGQAATAARGSPVPKNIARLMLASRNLSSNLADAGITASPDDIVGSLGSDDQKPQRPN